VRTQHCLDNRLTDGGKVVSLSRRQRSTPQTHFLVAISVRDCEILGPSSAAGLGKLKKITAVILYELEPATFRLVEERLNNLRYATTWPNCIELLHDC
jgi:hypothetical protein